MVKFLKVCALLVCLATGANAQSSFYSELPLQISDRYILPLRSLEDDGLQASLNQKLAVGLVDLADPYNVRYAAVNGNEMMYAASLPKSPCCWPPKTLLPRAN
mgnify:CR=1 FL=1